MREIELPANMVPGSPEAVAFIEAQVRYVPADDGGTAVPTVFDGPPGTAVEPAAVVAASHDASGYNLIISGLEMMLDGFKELRDA